MQVDPKNSVSYDGLDVHALVYLLWRQKLIIICLALLGAALGTTYGALSEPIYEAKAFIIPPTQNDIQSFNFGRANLPALTAKDVYAVFIKNIQAESLRREFFRNTYLPATGQIDDPRGTSYEKLSKNLLVSAVGVKDSSDRYSILILDGDPKQAARWVEEYTARAQELALQEINKNISSEFSVKAFDIQQRIVSLREVEERNREDALVNLGEALIVAKAIGLEKPPIVSSDSSSSLNIAGEMNGELTYMRGTKALEAEIANLKSRKSNDPFIKKLRGLENSYNFYKRMSERSQVAKTFAMDGVVESSSSPVKPKFTLLILVGAVFGLILGVLIVLIRGSFLYNEEGALRH